MCHLVSVLLLSLLIACLMQRTVNKTILRVHNGCLGVFFQLLLDACRFVVSYFQYSLCVGQLFHHLFRLAVHLEQFYGEIAGGIFVANLLVVLQFGLYCLYSLLYGVAVVEVDMSEHTVSRFPAVGEVLSVVAAVVSLILAVPVLYVLCHFGIYVSVLVDEIHSLIHVYYDVEEQIHPLSCLEHGRNHRHTEELS